MKIKAANALLEIKAVFLRPDEPFTWASGIKSPIYCDNRMTLSYPKIRTFLAESFAKIVQNGDTYRTLRKIAFADAYAE